MGAVTVKWIAEDPNGDDLSYHLMVRPSGVGDAWRTLEEDLENPFLKDFYQDRQGAAFQAQLLLLRPSVPSSTSATSTMDWV